MNMTTDVKCGRMENHRHEANVNAYSSGPDHRSLTNTNEMPRYYCGLVLAFK